MSSALGRRLSRLEEEARTSALEDEYRTLPRYEYHQRRALDRASRDEREALARYKEEEDWPAYLRLWEELLRRQAPSLADDVRRYRDVPWRILDRLEEEGRAKGLNHTTSQSEPEFWRICDARSFRSHAIYRGGLEPLEDEEAGRELVGRLLAAETLDEVRLLASLDYRGEGPEKTGHGGRF